MRTAAEREAARRLLEQGLNDCAVSRTTRTACRSLDTIRHARRTYAYPRHQFSNRSPQIRALLTDALDRLEIPWRQMNAHTISVARRKGVAALDEFVGRKR